MEQRNEPNPARCKCGGVAAVTMLLLENEPKYYLIGVSCMKCGKNEVVSVNETDPQEERASALAGALDRWNRRMSDGAK